MREAEVVPVISAEPRQVRRFIPSARTNLPQWPSLPPSLDPAGRGFIMVGIGAPAAAAFEAWSAAADLTGSPCIKKHHPDAPIGYALLDWFDLALSRAVVGWRLMLAGPPSDVLLLTARAREAGMIDAEIRSFAVEDGMSRLQCVHCKTVFRVEASPGMRMSCPGCCRTLVIHQHLSRRLAALVSFMADPEMKS